MPPDLLLCSVLFSETVRHAVELTTSQLYYIYSNAVSTSVKKEGGQLGERWRKEAEKRGGRR